MSRPRTRCTVCGKSNKSPHGLYMHDLRIHKRHNWTVNGLIRKKKAA